VPHARAGASLGARNAAGGPHAEAAWSPRATWTC